jgi:hypothetical protein
MLLEARETRGQKPKPCRAAGRRDYCLERRAVPYVVGLADCGPDGGKIGKIRARQSRVRMVRADDWIQITARDDCDQKTILIDVVEAKAIVAVLNPLGEVGDGWLVLRAPVTDGMAVKLKVGESEGFVDVCPDSLLVEMSVSFSDGGESKF